MERLTRQCQQERRIATQLMQIRREKDTIRNNRCVFLPFCHWLWLLVDCSAVPWCRILRQRQHEAQRTKEFEEALKDEAVSKALYVTHRLQ